MIEQKEVDWILPLDIKWSWDETHPDSARFGPIGMYMRFYMFIDKFIEGAEIREEFKNSDEAIRKALKHIHGYMLKNLIPCPDCGKPTEPVRAMEGHFLCKHCAWGPEPLKHFDWAIKDKWFSKAEDLKNKMQAEGKL